MASWTQPPKDIHVMAREYIEAMHPGKSLSTATDAAGRIIDITMPDLSDIELATLVSVLQSKFPGAF